MGLTTLVASVPENSDPVVAMVTLRGNTMRFRRPEPADFKSETEARKLLAELAPEWMGRQATLVYLLGWAYVPDSTEGEVKPYALIGELEEKNGLFFTDLVEVFFRAFPALSDWLGERSEAKNDSGGGMEPIGSESSASPSPSDATPIGSPE